MFLLLSATPIQLSPSFEYSTVYCNASLELFNISIAEISLVVPKSNITTLSSAPFACQNVASSLSLTLFIVSLLILADTVTVSFTAIFSGVEYTFNSAADANPPTPSNATSLTWVAWTLSNNISFMLPLASQLPDATVSKSLPFVLTWSSYLVIVPFPPLLLGS